MATRTPPKRETPDHFFVRVVQAHEIGTAMNEAHRLGFRDIVRRRLPARRGEPPTWLVEGEQPPPDACPLCGSVPDDEEDA